MSTIKTNRLKGWILPYLRFHISIPFFSIGTSILSESIETYTYEYIRLEVRLWKWSFSFNLYAPLKQWVNRHGERVAYYRPDDEMMEFLRKVGEDNYIVGLDWTGDRNIGFVVTPKPVEPTKEEGEV